MSVSFHIRVERVSLTKEMDMRTWLSGFTSAAVLLALGSVITPAFAQERGQLTANPGDAEFWAVADLSYDPTEPALLGARVGNPRDYPASFYSASRSGRCTSTLVGPRVLLTAAHCVGNGATATVHHAGRSARSRCTHAPDYSSNPTADWALCLFDTDLTGIVYETISINPGLVTVGTELQLTGFGCTDFDGTGGNDGVYRIGEAPVTGLPNGNDYDIVTEGDVALCFGDSGGPAFRYLDAQRQRRVQVSVNSRGNIRDTSYLSSLSTAPAIQFLDRWSSANGARICGIHRDTPNCRTTL